MLTGKNIAVAVTGSIAAFKALELVRLYVKAGAQVKVVMSRSAERFVGALSFEALTRNEVLTDENESWANEHNHIGLAKWADVFVVAPATR
jgi:phosphopantothenoylcysteine decarboxylase / phosphopantothenate---cysteine ligase